MVLTLPVPSAEAVAAVNRAKVARAELDEVKARAALLDQAVFDAQQTADDAQLEAIAEGRAPAATVPAAVKKAREAAEAVQSELRARERRHAAAVAESVAARDADLPRMLGLLTDAEDACFASINSVGVELGGLLERQARFQALRVHLATPRGLYDWVASDGKQSLGAPVTEPQRKLRALLVEVDRAKPRTPAERSALLIPKGPGSTPPVTPLGAGAGGLTPGLAGQEVSHERAA